MHYCKNGEKYQTHKILLAGISNHDCGMKEKERKKEGRKEKAKNIKIQPRRCTELKVTQCVWNMKHIFLIAIHNARQWPQTSAR
jgi:hypothetical protein